MSLEIKTFVLGPLDNNSYLVTNPETGEGIVIDPSFDIEILLEFALEKHINITAVWLTHAHYDHFAGLFALRDHFPGLKTAMHPRDTFLWKKGGLASFWNLELEPDFIPEISLQEGMCLPLGEDDFTVRHTPGHSPGHVIFYHQSLNCAFCGDLIFYRGVGRTDLPGGSETELENSILTQVYNLPPAATLYCGHGQSTIVGDEQSANPYI